MNPAAPSASQGRFRRFADFYPYVLASLVQPRGDFAMFRDMLLGRVRF
ncbi:MAG: hypothetical protein ACREXP_15460 [Steroidobacteraceae bacterium]